MVSAITLTRENAPMIEARGLAKRYGSTQVVNDLSYTALVLVAGALLLRRRDA